MAKATRSIIDNKGISFHYVNGKPIKVNSKNVLDEYFTKPDVAKDLFNKTQEIIGKYEKNIKDFTWLEPSAGNGVFFNLLPKNKIGIDIKPQNKDIIRCDYLHYELPNKKIIVIGNPPFGNRGTMALNFINHSQDADYVCFILPMFFNSVGKGSIKYRVKNFNLIHSENLKNDSFFTPNDNKNVNVKCVFQIWSKNYESDKMEFSWYNSKNKKYFEDILDIYTVSLAKNRECGKKWIFEHKADFYLSSTFFKENKVVKDFKDVKYKSGIAIVFKTNNKLLNTKLCNIFETANWCNYGSLSTNSCFHVGKSHIYQLLFDNLKDEYVA
jgi:hypothetical protein